MATIIKIPTGICVGLIMGEERNESRKTCHIFELHKLFQSNLFPSDETT